MAEEKQVWLYVSSLSFSHLVYILRKIVGPETTRSLLLDIAEIVTIVTVDSRNVRDALHLSFTDFEDALQHFAACAEAEPALEALVTRDPKGFATSHLAVLSPTEVLRRVL